MTDDLRTIGGYVPMTRQMAEAGAIWLGPFTDDADEEITVNLPLEAAAQIRDLIQQVDDCTAGDITLDLIEILRPITGPEIEEES